MKSSSAFLQQQKMIKTRLRPKKSSEGDERNVLKTSSEKSKQSLDLKDSRTETATEIWFKFLSLSLSLSLSLLHTHSRFLTLVATRPSSVLTIFNGKRDQIFTPLKVVGFDWLAGKLQIWKFCFPTQTSMQCAKELKVGENFTPLCKKRPIEWRWVCRANCPWPSDRLY